MELSPVWSQVQWLLNNGISLIPVRDKPSATRPAKTPYEGWKKYQSQIITQEVLWGLMEEKNTTAVAMICGAVSGNLEIIDIDVKYKPGIDAVIFSGLNKLYPVLYNRLRIHRTPSGGYHILYRIKDQPPPGNKKLAGRPATAAELQAQPGTKTYNFIETRGEGGYALAPPSMGYEVHQDRPIPIITTEERESIINLLHTYTEIIKIQKSPAPTKYDNDYYDENPFEHFNNGNEASRVLELAGWKYYERNANYDLWTRPGKADGTSASYHLEKRFYYIFTSSADIESARGYSPVALACELLHAGDWKKCYAWLVERGYGKIRKSVEQRMAKNKAIQNRPLPANASEEARTEFQAELNRMNLTYPHGIFWILDDEGELKISRELLYQVADGLGYKFYKGECIYTEGYTATKVDKRHFFNGLKQYIKEEDGDAYIAIADTFEAFLQRSGTFSMERLQLFDDTKLVRDTRTTAYKFYRNGYLYITGTETSFHDYTTISGLIWADEVLPRNYNPGQPGGKYLDFLNLATLYTRQAEHINRCIGYLTHRFKDETTGYIIVLTEVVQDSQKGGGSGKNIFGSLLGHITTYMSVPGHQARLDNNFLQPWNGSRILAISDVEKHFNFLFLKELTTGDGVMKKLYMDEVLVPCADMPKLIIQTNYSYTVDDGGLRRRIIPIEFTDFFTKCGGVDVHFGVHFPKGWKAEDWAGYDNFIARCIQTWIAGGLKLTPPELTHTGWLKRFENTHGAVTFDIINEYINTWINLGIVTNERLRSDLEDYYKDNNVGHNYRPSMRKISAAIEAWCKNEGVELTNDSQKIEGVTHRVKIFGPKPPEVDDEPLPF